MYSVLENLFHENVSARITTPFLKQEGVVSYADMLSFTSFQLLAGSIHSKHTYVNLLLVDCGLTHAQRQWCRYNDIDMIVPDDSFLVLKNESKWQRWNKPLFVTLSPYINTLLIDPNVMVTGSLDEVFATLKKEPVFMPINDSAPADDQMLYSKCIIRKVGVPLMRIYPPTKFVGFNIVRDIHLLRDWIGITGEAAKNENIRKCVFDFERGTLGWALVSHEMLNGCHLTRDYTCRYIGTMYQSPDEMVERVTDDSKDADIVHLSPKMYRGWNQEVLNFELRHLR